MIRENSILKASFTVFIITILAKIIGFIETAVVAAYFGTSAEIDLFFLANSICNKFIFTIFSGLAVVGVTTYNLTVKVKGKEGGNKFVSALLAYVICISADVTVFL